jgi:hypothetical protein
MIRFLSAGIAGRAAHRETMMKKAVAGLLAVLLAGCGTDYQARGADGGFSDKQLGPALWQVEITTNSYTDRALIREFALLRSAQLAVQHGYTHFAMADPHAGSAATRFVEPAADNTIVMFAGKPLVDGPVFDAVALCARLGPVHHVRC